MEDDRYRLGMQPGLDYDLRWDKAAGFFVRRNNVHLLFFFDGFNYIDNLVSDPRNFFQRECRINSSRISVSSESL